MELKNFFALDDQGSALGEATCYLYERGTESLAAGLLRANGLALSNPFTAGLDGLMQFAAPNGLYDLRVVKGDRDYRLHVQCNDVTEDVASAQAAASRAEGARDAAQLNAGLKKTIAEGLVTTVDGEFFSVPAAGSADYLVQYRNNAGAAQEVKRYPSVSGVKALLGGAEQLGPDKVSVRVDQMKPIASFTAKGPDDLLYELMSFFPNGSMSSGPLEAFLSAQIAGVKYAAVHADDRSLIEAQLGPDGLLYEIGGYDSKGQSLNVLQAGAQAQMELIHIPLLGQSNMSGDDAKPSLSLAATGWGNYRFARGVATWSAADNPTTPGERSAGGFKLQPLTAGAVESRANALADAYKAKLLGAGRFSVSHAEASPKVLMSYAGVGGRKLTELGPVDDGASGNPGVRAPGGHWVTLLDDVARGKAAADSLGYQYRLPCWFYDQGESEGDLKLYYTGSATTNTGLIAGYKALAKTMAEQFDTEARSIIGQPRPIPLFVTPACGNTLTPTAWLQLADESALVFMVGPRYHCPSAWNSSNGLVGASQSWGNFIHHEPDGHRWIGEMCAKVMYRVLHEGENWQPLRALSAAKFDGTHIDVTFHVPRPPLVVDTERLAKASGWGFSVAGGTADTPSGRVYASSVEHLADGRTLRLGFASIPALARLDIGITSACDLGSYPAASVGNGPATADGFETFTVTIAGDVREAITTLTREGAFTLRGSAPSQGIMRSVELVNGNTVLTGEVREVRTDGAYGPFTAGQTLTFERATGFTNLRDSDNALSLHTFAFGHWAGQTYPLYNWLAQYNGLAIKGA